MDMLLVLVAYTRGGYQVPVGDYPDHTPYTGRDRFTLDLFGTAVKSDRHFPKKYGALGDYMPEGFVKQQLFPFTWQG